jgi:light-regulated signal transduction histidine kinase (bacteriophytochrome)
MPIVDREQAFSAIAYGKAVVNILEDSATERARLRDTQRAVVNILEDAAGERGRLEMTQKAILNILEDSSTEKQHLQEIQKAVLNILDDLAGEMGERKRAQDSMRQLNAELDERVRALEAANKELEAFAYSVSHDLRSPLRAIDGFSRKVVATYGDRLDDEGRRQLQMVRDNALRMGKLIDDLLAFSRMGRREMVLLPLDMDAMARGVVNELCAAEPHPIEFAFSPLPPIYGDAAMLRQVWANLLGNAVKFSRQRPAARIELGGRAEGGEVLYWVKDNGAGFDMQYADKLFGVFQRLHRQDEFEGTGVGLAIAQRILYRHNGRIWGEGKPEAGATFWFALPASSQEIHSLEREGS